MQTKKWLATVLILIAIIATVNAATCASIEQFGITWTFDSDYECGQFANGDYWVVGPVTIVSIDPPSKVAVQGDKDEAGNSFIYSVVSSTQDWAITNSWNGQPWKATIYLDNTSIIDTSVVSWGYMYLYVQGTGNPNADRHTFNVDSYIPNTSITIWLAHNRDPVANFGATHGGTFGGEEINGSMINPGLSSSQGYVSGVNSANSFPNASWDPALNVAWDVNAQNPLTVPASSSLISTKSKSYIDTENNYSQVQRASVLTVLSSAPAANSFRPTFLGNDKTIHFNKDDLDYSFLKELTPVGNVPALVDMENQFQRPWIRKIIGSVRCIAPTDNMPEYWFASATNNGALALNLDLTTAQEKVGLTAAQITALNNSKKEKLFIEYVQLGLDWFGQYTSGGHGNPPDGGIYTGQLLPEIVFGRAFNYQPVWDMLAKTGNYRYSAKPGGGYYNDRDLPSDYDFIQELDQTFYITKHDVNITNNLVPGITWFPSGSPPDNNPPNDVDLPYTAEMIGMPEWGIHQATNPEHSTAAVNPANYRELNGMYNNQTAFLLLAMGLKEKVNYDAFFDYEDRYVNFYPSQQSAMRLAYRANYGCVWTRDDSEDMYSLGHYDCSECLYNCEMQDSEYCGDGTCNGEETTNNCNWDCQDSPSTPECVNLTALTGYIGQWKQGSLLMLSLMQKIEKWKAGTEC